VSDAPDLWLTGALGAADFWRSYPGYVHVIAAFEVVDDEAVPLMGVSRMGERLWLHLNRGYFNAHPSDLVGVLLHEIHHVVLGHLTHLDPRTLVYPDLMLLAMEVSANEYIREPLPGHPCRWWDYRDLGLCAHQSTLERYECLAQARRAGRAPPYSRAPVDRHLFLETTDPPDTGQPLLERILEGLQATASVGGAGEGVPIAGRAPAQLLDLLAIQSGARSSSLDWRQALAAFPRQLSPAQRAYSYSRPNRRFPERIGEVPGRLHRRRHRRDRPVLLIAIDTSASMDDATLAEIANEVARLADHAEITVVECDDVIRRVYPFSGSIQTLSGRRGTDLRPVFAPTFLARHRVAGVVYFTDGGGPWPPRDPGVPTLWVLTEPGVFRCPWGRQAWM
jgi:predicted metal-dependent peptidase